MERILVTGACGQIGTDLVDTLRQKYGSDNVVASDYRPNPSCQKRSWSQFIFLNVLDQAQLEQIVFDYKIDTIYHMAAVLSAKGENNPSLSYQVNLQGLYNVLEVARLHNVKRIIWPSSIAAFGPDSPKENTPNVTVMRPTTMYGITKVVGELLVDYYWTKFGVDTRSVRFPGIISCNTPGGGTTDYAIEMYAAAVRHGSYTCFVRADTVLPFMYMSDAIKGLIDLAEAEGSMLMNRVFNLAAMSFSARELETSIKVLIPEFTVEYDPDTRQQIADSWPRSLDDSAARQEWGWQPQYTLPMMTNVIIEAFKNQ